MSLVYKFTCNHGDCSHRPSLYIGSTITTLSKRITAHLQDGAIKRHYLAKHNTSVSRKYIEENTTTLHKEKDVTRIRMAESVYINSTKPTINIQLLPASCLPSQRSNATNSEDDQRALCLVHIPADAESVLRPLLAQINSATDPRSSPLHSSSS